MVRKFVPALVFLWLVLPPGPAAAGNAGQALNHALFDANPCLLKIQPSREEPAVEFHWGCDRSGLRFF